MIIIVKPVKADLEGINKLLAAHDLRDVTLGMISLDPCFVALDDGNNVVGFIWAMISQSGEVGYISRLVVDQGHKGIAMRLVKRLYKHGMSEGVREVFTVVKDLGETGEVESFKIQCSFGLKPSNYKFNYFSGTMKELGGIWVKAQEKTTTQEPGKLKQSLLGPRLRRKKSADESSKNS